MAATVKETIKTAPDRLSAYSDDRLKDILLRQKEYDFKSLHQSADWFYKNVREIIEEQLWKRIGFWSLDDYCRHFGRDADWLTHAFAVAGKAISEGRGNDPIATAIKAEKAPPLADHGGDRTREQRANSTLQRGSTDTSYLAARLRRDHPDIFERMKSGEYPSVRAAALEAGIVPKQITITANSKPETIARNMRRVLTDEKLRQLKGLL